MDVSDTHITRLHSGPAAATGSDYEAPYDGVVEDGFTTRLNIEPCHPSRRMSSGQSARTEEAMTTAGAKGMIGESMAITSMKISKRNKGRPSSP
jgi:hypothetical protein